LTITDCLHIIISTILIFTGKPIAASTPHFLFGEEEDVNNAIGIFPVEEKHETYIDLEPVGRISVNHTIGLFKLNQLMLVSISTRTLDWSYKQVRRFR